MTTDIRNLIFENLLTPFKEGPNNEAFFTLFANKAQETIDVCEYILSHFDLDLAEGFLLDIFGNWIGLRRPLKQEDLENLFTLCSIYDGNTDPTNQRGFYNSTDNTGGYFCSLVGIPSQTDLGAYISDADYRALIRTRASTFRKKATLDNLFNYYLRFGARVLIEDETARQVAITQLNYDDLNNWQRNFNRIRGFKPAGIKYIYTDNLIEETL